MDRSEEHKAYLEKNISHRREISFISKLIKKGGEIYTPSACYIKGKESIRERTFEVIFGGRSLDIPYSKAKDIWIIDSGEIKIELDSAIILDEKAEMSEQLKLEKQVGNGEEKVDKREQHKAYLEKNVSQRRELSFISKLIKKGGEIYTPSACFINGKESIRERTFEVIFGGRSLDIPYSKVKDIRIIDSGEIKIELDSAIILDEKAEMSEQLKFV